MTECGGSMWVARAQTQLTYVPGTRPSTFARGVSLGPPRVGRISAVLEEQGGVGGSKVQLRRTGIWG